MSLSVRQLLGILALCVLGALLAVYAPALVFVLLVLAMVVWLLSFSAHVGWYILLFLYPLLGWSVSLSSFDLTKGTFLASFNAPVADFWALILITAVGIWMLREDMRGRAVPLRAPRAMWFGFFVLSALVSLFNAPATEVFDGFRFIIRNLIFIYVAYVVLPTAALRNQDQIKKSVGVLLSMGVVLMGWGIASLFVLQPFWGVWRRVSPFGIGGWAPLGLFHNDLAEVMVVMVPLALWWYANEKRDHLKRIALLYVILMTTLTLLTFSRTAWIVLFVQLLVYWMLSAQKVRQRAARIISPVALMLLIPIGAYMVFFSASDYVASSTSSRLDMTRIALMSFAEHPFIGNGAGRHIDLIAGAEAFRIVYGPAFDAHGVIQKLLSEQGLFGLISFFAFVLWLVYDMVFAYKHQRAGSYKQLLLALCAVAIGAVVYQLFNTQYYTAKMWVPVGFAYAASRLKH